MNTHLQTLLSRSGFAKRNIGMSLLGAYKFSGKVRIPHLISPTNKTLRAINLQTSCQKLKHRFRCMLFPSVCLGLPNTDAILHTPAPPARPCKCFGLTI